MAAGDTATLLGAVAAIGTALVLWSKAGGERRSGEVEAIRILADELRVELDRCIARRVALEDAIEGLTGGERYP